jgi:hypothetical protein
MAMQAQQHLRAQGKKDLAIRLAKKAYKALSSAGSLLRASQSWITSTPEGAVNAAVQAVGEAQKSGRNKKKAKAADQVVDEIKKTVEAVVPEAAEAATAPESYDFVQEIISAAEETPAADGNTENPKPRRPKDRNWVAQMADALAAKVDVKTPSPRNKTAAQQMLSEFLYVAKDAAPKHADGSKPGNPAKNTEAFQSFLSNRAKYEKAVRWAQQVIAEKYADNPEMLQVFQDWLNNGINLTNVLNGVIREHGVNINAVLRQSWDNKAAAVNAIKNNILANTDLTPQQKAEAAEMIHGRF